MMARRPAAAATQVKQPTESRPQRRRSRSGRPRIVVAGSQEFVVRKVSRRLDRLAVRVEAMTWEELLDHVDATVAAIVIIHPVARIAGREALEILHDHPGSSGLPLFSVVPDSTTDRQVRGLYRAGATAVFEWPRESRILDTLFAELYGMVQVRGPRSKSDKSLAETVRAHLRLGASRGCAGLRVVARGGLISVSGQTKTLAQKQEMLDVISRVPGVRGVVSDSLRVLPADISNRSLSRRVRHLLRSTLELDDSTLAVSTDRGHVRLTGTLRDKRDLLRFESLISHLRGVRRIESAVSISVTRQQQDSRVARRLRKSLANLYSRERVHVTVVGGTVVLAGNVSLLATKRSIEQFVNQDNAVDRVVNKIQVEKGR